MCLRGEGKLPLSRVWSWSYETLTGMISRVETRRRACATRSYQTALRQRQHSLHSSQSCSLHQRILEIGKDGGFWAIEFAEHQYWWRWQSIVRSAHGSFLTVAGAMLTIASGNNANSNQPATQPQSSGGLFGASQQQQPQQQPQPQQQQQQQPQSASLFGAQPSQPQSGSLFGGNSQQNQAPAQSGGLL